MRNSRLQRDRALIVLAVAGLVAVTPYALPLDDDADSWRIVLLTVGGTVAAIAGILALLWHGNVRTQAALERGEGAMGAWRVSAADWRAFVELERQFALQPNVWQNEFKPLADAASHDVDVTVGTTGVVIDGSVHALPRHGLPELRGARLRRDAGILPSVELHLFYPAEARDTGWVAARSTTLRFPVAAGAEGAAGRYVAWCEGGRPGEATFFHGPGDGTDAEDLSTCRACGRQTHAYVSRCRHCGGAMLSRRWARRLGMILIVLGLALAVGTGFLLWQIAPGLLGSGAGSAGMRIAGGRPVALGVLALLGAVAGLGVVSLVSGVWQVRTGTRSLRLIRASLIVVGLAVAAAVGVAAAS